MTTETILLIYSYDKKKYTLELMNNFFDKIDAMEILGKSCSFSEANIPLRNEQILDYFKREFTGFSYSKLRGYKRGHLFSIGLEYNQYLKEGIISEELQKKFEICRHPVPSNATISKKDDTWVIQIDDSNKWSFEESYNQLHVYIYGKLIPDYKRNGFFISNLIADSAPKVSYNPEHKLFSFFSDKWNILPEDSETAPKLVDIFLELNDVVLPEYGWGDNWKMVVKQEGNDPRPFIWGMNYWNRELTELIGREEIKRLAGDKWTVREYSNGGISLTGIPNPFLVDKKEKTRIEKVLKLQEKLGPVLKTSDKKKMLKAEKEFW